MTYQRFEVWIVQHWHGVVVIVVQRFAHCLPFPTFAMRGAASQVGVAPGRQSYPAPTACLSRRTGDWRRRVGESADTASPRCAPAVMTRDAAPGNLACGA